MRNDGYTPLDPKEGPTIWVRQLNNNRHTVTIVEGTDPENPLNYVRLSHQEIKKLASFIEDNNE